MLCRRQIVQCPSLPHWIFDCLNQRLSKSGGNSRYWCKQFASLKMFTTVSKNLRSSGVLSLGPCFHWRNQFDQPLHTSSRRCKLTPTQVIESLLTRLEKRMEALQRVKLDGCQMVIAELEVEKDYLRRAKRYFEG
jgi:hypothetical protein